MCDLQFARYRSKLSPASETATTFSSNGSANTFCKPRLGSDNETAFRASPGARFGIHKSYPFTDIDRPRKRVASLVIGAIDLAAPAGWIRRRMQDDGKAKRKRSDPAEMRKLAALAMAKVKGETSSGYAEC